VERLRDRPGRRRLLRVQLGPDLDLFVKQQHRAGRRHPLRDGLKRLLRVDPAWREWRALCALRDAGVRVPRPRALGVLADGDRVLAMDHVAAEPLPDALASCGPAAPRRMLAERVGRLVAALHSAGWIHGDLHRGNFLVDADGPLLVDLQAARRSLHAAARLRDLGELDHALAAGLSLFTRVRLRAAALGVARPFSAADRRRLRAAGRAAQLRRRAQVASRTRRALRPGRRFSVLRVAGARGLRRRSVEEPLLRAALEDCAEDRNVVWLSREPGARVAAVTRGERRLVVEEFDESGWPAALRSAWRGSRARRGWLGGLGLEVHRLGAAAPLAFVEGRPGSASRLVLEDLRPAHAADADAVSDAEAADALQALLIRLHGWAVDAGDLRASRVLLRPGADALRAHLLGLEAVRFLLGAYAALLTPGPGAGPSGLRPGP
jgi:tRNA A-37 threonylcarbamoyl transferase component Bud32